MDEITIKANHTDRLIIRQMLEEARRASNRKAGEFRRESEVYFGSDASEGAIARSKARQDFQIKTSKKYSDFVALIDRMLRELDRD